MNPITFKPQQKPTHAHRVSMGKRRLMVVGFFINVAFIAIAFRLFSVTILGYTGQETKEREIAEVYFERADIVDRNGELLAINLATASLFANPQLIMEPEYAAIEVSHILPEFSKEKLLKIFTSGKSFVWLKRGLTPKEQYAINALGVPGLQFEREEKRVYPHGTMFSHVLGYTGVDGVGLAGVEKSFEDRLNKDAQHPLQLSLDVRVQSAMHAALAKYVKTFSAVGGSGMVMDIHTGEVLAMVSLPDFDPQDVGKAKPRAKFNQVTLGVYEQGSTFKTLTMASAVDTHSVNISKMYDVKQPIKVGRFRIRDTHPKDMLNASEIYLHSSNIGTAKIALDMGIANQKEYLEKLGIFAPLTIEIPEKGEPLLPKQWSEVTSMTVSFGHGIAVTPVHVVQATAAIMNGGIFHPATLIKQPEGIIPEGRRVVSEDTSEYMRRLFRMNVLEGTGKRANVEGYMVGGKTGTAEKAQAGGYNRKAMLSSFVAAFPMHEPKYVVYVMLDEPKGTKETGGFATGGMVAAPVVKEVISNIAPMLGLRPIDNHDMDIKKEFYVEDENGTGAREYAALTTF